MAHSWIEASLKYRKAQAKVLQEADALEASGWKDTASLLQAVRAMREAKALYISEKSKISAETYG